jgi:hypothetical protein
VPSAARGQAEGERTRVMLPQTVARPSAGVRDPHGAGGARPVMAGGGATSPQPRLVEAAVAGLSEALPRAAELLLRGRRRSHAAQTISKHIPDNNGAGQSLPARL